MGYVPEFIHLDHFISVEYPFPGFKIENPEVIEKNVNLPFVVIDDLCDGGGTFKGIAQLLGFHYPDRERTIHSQ